MIEILYEDNHLLCIVKPVNLPVQKDASEDDDVLSLCKQYIKETYHKPGNVYLGLVHRLDRPVGGAMVFAKTSKAASRLSESIRTNAFEKTYLAILDGIPTQKQATIEDYLVKDTKTNMVSVTDKTHGKYAKLDYNILSENGKHALAEIHLETGRSHQIRVQFASRKLPLVNDQRYNQHATKGQIALWSCGLSFPHPTTKERITVHSYPSGAPWDEFKESI